MNGVLNSKGFSEKEGANVRRMGCLTEWIKTEQANI